MRSWPLAFVLFALGCGASAPTRAALQSDLQTLRLEIEKAKSAGSLDESAVRELAAAVAERELRSARGDLAVQRVREFRACSKPLEDTLMDLSKGESSAAAAATHALLAAKVLRAAPLFERHFLSADPEWRAVAARAAVGPARSSARHQFFTDGDLRVRRAALHAAVVDPAADNLAELAQVARLDPDPLSRSLAVQVLGALGGKSAVRMLRELWKGAESATRQGIVTAWSRRECFDVGGETALLWVLETQADLPVVVAAERLLSRSARHAGQAVSVLERIVQAGPIDEQRLAIRLSPSHPSLEAAIAEKLSKEVVDEHLQVMAAARLVRTKKFDKLASKRLRELLQSKSETIRRQATAALVATREPAVVTSLKEGLDSRSEWVRRQSAVGLFLLGHPADAAPLLADERAQVRSHVACSILAQR